MRKTIYILCLLLAVCVMPCQAGNNLDAATQKKVVDCVEKYCKLLKEISGNVENIDKQEELYGMCENENVSVFNDLVPPSKDISSNSLPLQQYMMMITSKYENEVKTSFSGFKYLKTVTQPSIDPTLPAAQYALVKVSKTINATGLKGKPNLNIVVNVMTMKISSTISEDYEDPQRIYLDALEKYNSGNYEGAIPDFQKISGYSRYPGRFRAMTMLGWSYLKINDYDHALQALKTSSENDPLGGIVLASEVYLQQNIPARYQNLVEGQRLLDKYGEIRDKEVPYMHLIARNALISLYMKGTLSMNYPRMKSLILSLKDDPGANTMYKVLGLCYEAQMDCQQGADGVTTAYRKVALADSLANGADNTEEMRLKCKRLIVLTESSIMMMEGKVAEANKLIEDNRNLPNICKDIASIFYKQGNYDKALEYYTLGANEGDGFSAFVMATACYPYAKSEKLDELFVNKFAPFVKNDKKWLDFLGFLLNNKSVNKSLENHYNWIAKGAEKGEPNSMTWKSLLDYEGCGCQKDECKGLTELCEIGKSGNRSLSNMFMNIGMYMTQEILVNNESQAFACLDNISKEGNSAADFLMSSYYDFKKDSANYIKYLKRSSDGEFYEGMQMYGTILLDGSYGVKDTLQAYEIFKKLSKYGNSMAVSILGGIEAEHFHNYQTADSLYAIAIDENDFNGYLGRGDLYKNGWGVKRDLELAREFYDAAITAAAVRGFDYLEPTIREMYIAPVDELIKKEYGENTIANFMKALNDLTNHDYSEDKRIVLSEKCLKKVFTSPKAVVRTANLKTGTVVASETADDFILRLATTDKKLNLKKVAAERDAKGKLNLLIVSESE